MPSADIQAALDLITNHQGLGFVRTIITGVYVNTTSVGTANTMRCVRVIEGGTISKVRVHIANQSGNICVAAYRNTGSGINAVPGVLLASSGSIACPVAGEPDIPLGATVTLLPGDWLAFGSDNIVATFTGVTGVSANNIAAGHMGFVNAYPAADSPALTLNSQNAISMLGIP